MTLITGIEGSIEGSWQFVLQLFIVFHRPDRQPTLIQLLVGFIYILKPLQNKKGQKNLEYPRKKQSFSL